MRDEQIYMYVLKSQKEKWNKQAIGGTRLSSYWE